LSKNSLDPLNNLFRIHGLGYRNSDHVPGVVGVASLYARYIVQLRQHGRKTLASPEAAHGPLGQSLHLEDKLVRCVRHCLLTRGYIPAAVGCHYEDANRSKVRNKSKHLGRSFRHYLRRFCRAAFTNSASAVAKDAAS
jgi:hypothetical protein